VYLLLICVQSVGYEPSTTLSRTLNNQTKTKPCCGLLGRRWSPLPDPRVECKVGARAGSLIRYVILLRRVAVFKLSQEVSDNTKECCRDQMGDTKSGRGFLSNERRKQSNEDEFWRSDQISVGKVVNSTEEKKSKKWRGK
jgi:hypothetical protein